MSHYKEIRNKNGVLRVSVDQRNALDLMNNISGKWVERNSVDGGRRMVYEFTTSGVVTRCIGLVDTGIEITIFKGDYIDINKE